VSHPFGKVVLKKTVYGHVRCPVLTYYMLSFSSANATARSDYKDESDIFYQDPTAFIQDYFQTPALSHSGSKGSSFRGDPHNKHHTDVQKMYENGGDTVRDPMDKRSVAGQDYFIEAFRLPSHIVMFDSLFQTYPEVQTYLNQQGWSEVS
jgi:hypothetical protein